MTPVPAHAAGRQPRLPCSLWERRKSRLPCFLWERRKSRLPRLLWERRKSRFVDPSTKSETSGTVSTEQPLVATGDAVGDPQVSTQGLISAERGRLTGHGALIGLRPFLPPEKGHTASNRADSPWTAARGKTRTTQTRVAFTARSPVGGRTGAPCRVGSQNEHARSPVGGQRGTRQCASGGHHVETDPRLRPVPPIPFYPAGIRPCVEPAEDARRNKGLSRAAQTVAGRHSQRRCEQGGRPAAPASRPGALPQETAPQTGRATTASAPPSGWFRRAKVPPWRSTMLLEM